MKITTNNVPRDLFSFAELIDPGEIADLDYIENDDRFSDRLFRYKGAVHDIGEFVRIAPRASAVGFEHGADEGSPLLTWDGIQTDTYFSGIVVRMADDGERAIVGRYYAD